MKITGIELIRYSRGITVHAGAVDWLWVRIHTSVGIVGLGETYPCSDAEAGAITRELAPVLLGRDARQIDLLWADMFTAVGYHGWAGAEMRAISAIDIALWDIAGQAAGVPIYQLLGGASRDAIPVYNTCYDHVDFHAEPVRLARELAASGIRAMKIWPFDPVAKLTRGNTRNLPCAKKIARAIEPLEPMWLEEMLPQDNMAAYRELASSTRLPLTISERLMTRWGFRELLENRAASIIMPDICWCGGISEAKKIASMAEAHYLPVAPHNCGGPVLHAASAHLAANLTNLFILETVRRHYLDEYRGLLSTDLVPSGGQLPLPPGPGLGVRLDESVLSRDCVSTTRLG